MPQKHDANGRAAAEAKDDSRSVLKSLRLGSTKQDAVYAPEPPDAASRPSVLLSIAGFILITEFCERLAYYGFAGSLVLYFQVSAVACAMCGSRLTDTHVCRES